MQVTPADPGDAPPTTRAEPADDDGMTVLAPLFGLDGLEEQPGVTHAELTRAAVEVLRQVLGVDDVWFVESETLAEDVARWTEHEHGVGVGNPTVPGTAGGRTPLGALGCVPVECAGRRVGVLLARGRAARAWTSRDRKVLRSAATELGQALTATAAHQRSGAERLAEEMGGLRTELLHLLDHELRTPLAVMLGGLEMLGCGALGELTPRQQEMVARLERNAERLLEVARSVTRVGERSIDPDLWGTGTETAARLDEVLALAVEDLGATAPTVTCRSGPFVLDLPRPELRELLDRVLSNAVKFTPAGGEVTITTSAKGAGLVEVRVHDTGCGIAPTELPRIGEPFYRSSTARDQETQGVGLGLAAAQRIARMWGGHLHLRSEPGVGTEVSVLLPGRLAPPASPASSATPAPAQPAGTDASGSNR